MYAIRTLLLALCLLPGISRGASVITETFSSGANGWTGITTIAGSWAYTGGTARVTFNAASGPPPNGFAMLFGSNSASAGSFTGDYKTAGIETFGFKVIAMNGLPGGGTNIVVRWANGTSVFSRAFLMIQTGVWHSFSVNISDPSLGGWFAETGTLHDYSSALQNVQYLQFSVFRPGYTTPTSSAQTFHFDDIFLAPLHAASEVIPVDEGVRITWSSVRTDLVYQVETAADILSPWQYITNLFPTATTHTAIYSTTNTASPALYRLVQ